MNNRQPETIFTDKATAEAIASKNNADDHDWQYVVVETGEDSRRYVIRIYDEFHYWVGSL
jgi:hypothetical protein